MATTLPIDLLIDAKGQMCPMPVLMLAKAIKTLQSGQILVIAATDAGAKKDIPAWAEKTANLLIGMTEESGVYTFYIKKA